MKKGIILFLSVLLCFTIAACAEQKTKPPVSEQSSGQEQSDTQNSTEVSENQSAKFTRTGIIKQHRNIGNT